MRYEHGGDIYRNQVEYDFSVNVNPLGLPENCIEAAQLAINECYRYPDSHATKLRQTLAHKYGIDAQKMIFGNGAAELIYALCHALRPKKALVLAPTFSEYESAVTAVDGEVVYHRLNETNAFAIDQDFVESIQSDIDIVFLCNPNNPTGKLIKDDILEKIVDRCEQLGCYLCIDECFLPFVEDENAHTYLTKTVNHHVIVLRAFTKIYAMAGIRLGYMQVNDDALLKKMYRQMQPWNTSVLAQCVGVAALDNDDYIARTRRLLAKEKAWMQKQLQILGIKVYESDANYLLFYSSEEFGQKLLEHKILLRDCSNFEGLEKGYYRIAIRTHAENEKLIACMKNILE